MSRTTLVPVDRIERTILVLRGQRVLLDADLAALYGVETKTLNRAVKRNLSRFLPDFMFRLTQEEANTLRCHSGTSKSTVSGARSFRGDVTSERGGRRYLPYAFTEQGVAMLSSVLRSRRAVQVNVGIMRAFVRLRQMLLTHAELSRKLALLERRYDAQFKSVFEAIRELMAPAERPKRMIGFGRSS
jgi:hypothetical protein